jgi:hypothetical protein
MIEAADHPGGHLHAAQVLRRCVHVLEAIGGNPFARAGVETAFWDLEAQRREFSGQVLGGSRTRIDAGLAAGIAPTMCS